MKIPKGWAKLPIGEKVRSGDKFFNPYSSKWNKSRLGVGFRVGAPGMEIDYIRRNARKAKS